MSLWNIVASKLSTELAFVVLPILGAIIWAILKWSAAKFSNVYDFFKSRERALAAVAKVKNAAGSVEGQGVWVTRPIVKPDNYENDIKGARILTIANLKGGVGKTTIAANIAAYLSHDSAWRKRVLLIDLDYQGSLSSMAFPNESTWLPPQGADSIATAALSAELQPNMFLSAAKEVRQQPRLKVITAHYDLAQADNRLLVQWLLNVKGRDDRPWSKWISDVFLGKVYQPSEMRYNLAKLLLSRAVQDSFDLIIIDCPPRLTSGTVQALCASSNILIPTILDKPSGESVISFCEQIESLKKSGVCPFLSHVGIVATRYVPNYIASRQAMQRIKDQLLAKDIPCGFLPQHTFVPQTQALVRESSEGIAFFTLGGDNASCRAKTAFAELAQNVALQTRVPPMQTFDHGNSVVEPIQLKMTVAAE